MKNGGNRHRLSLSKDGVLKCPTVPISQNQPPLPTVLTGTPGGRLRFLVLPSTNPWPLHSSSWTQPLAVPFTCGCWEEAEGSPLSAQKVGGAADCEKTTKNKTKNCVPSFLGCWLKIGSFSCLHSRLAELTREECTVSWRPHSHSKTMWGGSIRATGYQDELPGRMFTFTLGSITWLFSITHQKKCNYWAVKLSVGYTPPPPPPTPMSPTKIDLSHFLTIVHSKDFVKVLFVLDVFSGVLMASARLPQKSNQSPK